MKDGKVYVSELPLDGWRETGIALELPHSELPWLERNVSHSDHLALVNQWSRDGIHWQYDPPMVGGKQRALAGWSRRTKSHRAGRGVAPSPTPSLAGPWRAPETTSARPEDVREDHRDIPAT